MGTPRHCLNPLDWNATNAWWGPPTSSIDWCERNRADFIFVEPVNTLSNLAFIVPSLLGAYWAHATKFSVMFLLVALIGVGSFCFHASLLFTSQLFDELPMIWAALGWCYVVYSPWIEKTNVFAALLLTFAAIEAAWHVSNRPTVAFQLLFALLAVAVLPGSRKSFQKCDDPEAQRIFKRYLLCGLLGVISWLIDNTFCESLSFNLHAAWHFLMAANCYYGITFGCYADAQRLKQHPIIHYSHSTPLFPRVVLLEKTG